MAQYKVEVDQEANLVRVVVTGAFSIADGHRVVQAIVDAPGFRSGMDSLVDSRDATTDYSAAAVRTAAPFPSQSEKRGEGYRTAVVVSRVVDFGMGRMAQAWTEDRPFESRFFFDYEEAEEWLKEPR
jgi:hypothetical protein